MQTGRSCCDPEKRGEPPWSFWFVGNPTDRPDHSTPESANSPDPTEPDINLHSTSSVTLRIRMTTHPSLYPLSAVTAAGLGLHGFRSGSLNWSGAIAAAAFGYSTLANPLNTFSAALLTFYLTGSRITKVRLALSSPPHTIVGLR